MKKIIVASKNPVKIVAAQSAFERMFPDEVFEVEGVSVASGVSEQPTTDAEAYQGALNRLQAVRTVCPEAEYWVAFESGIEKKGSDLEAFAWAAIEGRDGRFGKGRSVTFFLPPEIAQLMATGKELGEADDIVFKRTNAKQENGIVGILTGNVITRTNYHADAAIFALIPFKNPHLYP
jgi:inosine/xanthosine triphosphatase